MALNREARMYSAGDTVEARTLTTIDGSQVRVPAPDHTVHLQFRRFAGSTSLIGGLAPGKTTWANRPIS
jgi:hypothetical protein